jgi:hypothetical protein
MDTVHNPDMTGKADTAGTDNNSSVQALVHKETNDCAGSTRHASAEILHHGTLLVRDRHAAEGIHLVQDLHACLRLPLWALAVPVEYMLSLKRSSYRF